MFLITVCLALGMVNAWGQAVGTLNGTVLDAAGAVVPGAAVVAINDETKVENKTTSTSAGAYTIPYLQQGTYTIRATMPGFRAATAENVILRAAQTLTMNIKLEIGQVSDNVTVSDTPPLLESGTAEMGSYINQAEFKAWPIIVGDGQRQIQEFIFDSLPGTTGGTFQGSINGGQQYSHEILIDGIALGRADLSGGNNNEMSPSLDAIGDFKLQTGAVGAEYNGGQTAVANFSIKSGTNDLHGAVFEYLQNEDFNAASLDTTTTGGTKGRYRDNNWGYAAGGPVIIPKLYNGRNRTFWFTNFEHDKRNQLDFSGFTVLSPTEYRTGDFSKMLTSSWTGQAQAGSTIGTDAQGRPVVFGAIYDPKTTRTGPTGAVLRDPFPGNIIPTNRIDPVAAAILKVGLVNPTYDTLLRNTPQVSSGQPFFDEHIIGIKVDQIITDKHRISVFYNQGYRERNNIGGGRYLPVPGPPTTGWQDQLTPSEMGRLSLTSTITPTLINNFALGYNRFLNQNGAPLYTVNQNWADKIGIKNTSATVFPLFTFSGSDWQGGTIDKIAVGSYGAGANGSRVLKDDATKILGKHTIHFGYQYTQYFYDEENYSGSGTFAFNPGQTALPGFTTSTGNAFASFLLGAANHASNSIAALSDGFRGPYHALWVSDDFKVTPRLTATLGFRWEIITPFFERTNRMSYIDLAKPDPTAGGLPGLLVFKNRPSTTYWGEIGPRLGLAYQVSNKIVVRAGYAMMNTPPTTNNWGYGGFTTGYNANINVAAGSSPTGFALDPAMYLSQPFPSLGFTLPDTSPASAHFNASQTSAPDANRPGYVQNWNLTVQYMLPMSSLLEVAYVGNKGTRLWGFNEYDVVPATNLKLGDTLLDPVSSHPQYIPYAGFPTNQTVAQAMLPYPQFNAVNDFYAYNSNSNYNSLQVTVTKHLTQGLGFLAAYTWSKTIGYQDSNGATGYGVPQDFFNRGLERSVASFNLPQNFKLTWTYEVPVGKGRRWDFHWANYIIGGWQLAGLQNYSSGFPISVGSSGLNTPTGFGNIRPDIVSGQPLTLGSLPTKIDWSKPVQWLNPAAFANVPTSGNGVPLRVGTAPRNLNLRGPMVLNETMRASKAFAFWGERAKFRVGMTMTNPFKRTYAYITDTTVGDSGFGQVLQGGGNRTMQLDARIDF
jgi:Carboxypeptidase regulatory-like domain